MENQEIEIWKPVVGFEGLYEISNLGRVMSCRKMYGSVGPMGPQICKDKKCKSGYQRIVLYKENKRYDARIHKLVCVAFIPNTENKRTINHKNGIKTDNRLSNLEWATDKENLQHAYDVLKRKSHWKGRRCLPVSVVKLDVNFNLIKEYVSISEASKEGFRIGGISSVCKGLWETHKGFRWMTLENYNNKYRNS